MDNSSISDLTTAEPRGHNEVHMGPTTLPPFNPSDLLKNTPGNFDTIWVLITAFFMFGIQTGLTMMEGGMVNAKCTANAVFKGAADLILSSTGFWVLGYGFLRGTLFPESLRNVLGFGEILFLQDAGDGFYVYTDYIYKLAACVTAASVVSGALAERGKLISYLTFTFLNGCFFGIPAHWMWDKSGWLSKLGAIDNTGACVVHIYGGTCAAMTLWLLGPRYSFIANDNKRPNPSNAFLVMWGLFFAWWGWIGLNTGTSYDLVTKVWRPVPRVSANTLLSSFGGGNAGILVSVVRTKGHHYSIILFIYSILGSLVSVTASCQIYSSTESVITGFLAGLIACFCLIAQEHYKKDDPLACISTNVLCGVWGMFTTGLLHKTKGLFYGGGVDLLLIQLLASISTMLYAGLFTLAVLKCIGILTNGVRLSEGEERLGADCVEHLIVYQEVDDDHVMAVVQTVEEHEVDENQIEDEETVKARKEQQRKQAAMARKLGLAANVKIEFRERKVVNKDATNRFASRKRQR